MHLTSFKDHMQESNRMEELQVALLHIAGHHPKLPHLLVGDFNALTKSDYTEEDWKHISEHRASNK